MGKYTEHYAKQAMFYADLATKRKISARIGGHGREYAQQDWESALYYEDRVVHYATNLMAQLEHENAVMLDLFKKGILK